MCFVTELCTYIAIYPTACLRNTCSSKLLTVSDTYVVATYLVKQYAKQKHPGCKKSARPIRSSIANRYVRPKTLISVEAKKLLIKNLFNYLNDIQ